VRCVAFGTGFYLLLLLLNMGENAKMTKTGRLPHPADPRRRGTHRVSPKRPLTLYPPSSAFDAAPGMSTGCPGADVTNEF
jgi:hypothetical protein